MSRSGVRLTGGVHRGRRLEMPPGEVRPTEGRVREALFSMWQARLTDAAVLDLFAGSGAVGLEALGRGARRAVFVEASPRGIRALQNNLRTFGEGRVEVLKRRLPARLPELRSGFDLIFADPPYDFPRLDEVIAAARDWITSEGELCVEHSRRRTLPDDPAGWRRRDLRCYGESCLSFYRPDSEGGEGEAE